MCLLSNWAAEAVNKLHSYKKWSTDWGMSVSPCISNGTPFRIDTDAVETFQSYQYHTWLPRICFQGLDEEG